MTATTTAVKSTARQILKGRFAVSATVSAMALSGVFLCIYLPELIGICAGKTTAAIMRIFLSIFVVFPLLLGVLRFFRRMQWEAEDKPIVIFHYFSSLPLYKRSLLLIGNMIFKIMGATVLIYLPLILLILATNSEVYGLFDLAMPTWAASLGAIVSIFKLLSEIVLFLVILRYYLAPFLFVADEKMDPAEAVLTSKIISRRTYYDLLALIVSLAVYILPSILLVPLIFFLPLLVLSYLVHCRYAVAEYNEMLETAKNSTESFSA